MSAQIDSATSPAPRLQQNQVISAIPHEIFLEIFSYFGPTDQYEFSDSDTKPDVARVDMMKLRHRTIHNMALVCRDFYQHLFPLLFENTYASGSDVEPNKEGVTSHCDLFCRSIVDGDERARNFATYIKKFAIVDLYMGKRYKATLELPVLARILSTFFKALAYMANLKALYLCNISITDDFLRSAICLPPLQVLQLVECNIPQSLDGKLLARFSTLHVNHIYAEQEKSYTDGFPYDQFTRHLCMSRTERFTSQGCTEGNILRGLAVSPLPLEHMQHLYLASAHLDRTDSKLFSNVLAVMPALTFLHITEVHYYGRHWDFKGDEAEIFMPCKVYPKLPHLVHIHAPFFAVQAIVPGSNASSVGFSRERLTKIWPSWGFEYASDDEFWQSCAVFLAKSKCPISQLDIPVRFYWIVSFAIHFPEIRRLTLNTAHCNWGGSSFCLPPNSMVICFLKSWDAHPRLDELQFIYEDYLPDNAPACFSLPQSLMHLLKERIPTLRVLKFLYAGSNSEQYVDMSSLESK